LAGTGFSPCETNDKLSGALAPEAMSRPTHRIKQPGAYFINSETWQRHPIFQKELNANVLIEMLLEYRQQGAYRLHDFVVMPDHMHLILTPGPQTSLEKAMQLIKGGSSHRIGKESGGGIPVWQPGFRDHWIRSMEDYLRCRAYIHENPVKAGMAEKPEAYLFSSANGKFDLDPYPSGAKAPDKNAADSAGLKPRPAKSSE
jgi:putative transposase